MEQTKNGVVVQQRAIEPTVILPMKMKEKKDEQNKEDQQEQEQKNEKEEEEKKDPKTATIKRNVNLL